MIPSPGFDIYETWKSKEGGRGFKVIIWGKGGGGGSATKSEGTNFYGEWAFVDTMLLVQKTPMTPTKQ